MILKDSLYKIINKTSAAGDKVRYDLSLDANHFIYRAHFPGVPITPGVCIVQMVKEVLEDYLQRELEIIKVKNVKFLSVIDPVKNSDLYCELGKVTDDNENNQVAVQAIVASEENAFSKVSLICGYK